MKPTHAAVLHAPLRAGSSAATHRPESALKPREDMQNTDRTRVPSPQSAVQLVQGLAYQPYSWQGSALHFWEADGGSSAQHVPPPVNSCGTCCLVATSRQCT